MGIHGNSRTQFILSLVTGHSTPHSLRSRCVEWRRGGGIAAACGLGPAGAAHWNVQPVASLANPLGVLIPPFQGRKKALLRALVVFGGEGGIRTPGTPLGVQQISNLSL